MIEPIDYPTALNNAFPGKGELSWDEWARRITDKVNSLLPESEEKTGVKMGEHKTATKHCDLCNAEKGWIHLYKECSEEKQECKCTVCDSYKTMIRLSEQQIRREEQVRFTDKLSKYVQDGIDECNEPGKHIGGVAVLREMQMAFRLKDKSTLQGEEIC